MLNFNLAFCAIVLLIATACSDSENEIPAKNMNRSNSDTGGGSIAVMEKCTPSDNSKFLALVDGTWQRYYVKEQIPICRPHLVSNKITQTFLTFDQNQKIFEDFDINYLDLFECLTSEMGVGIKATFSKPMAVDLCQTESLVKEFGSNYYFLKDRGDYYSIIGTTQDRLGRVVVMLSDVRSLNYNLINWTQEETPVYPYINHNDYKEVKLP